MCRIFFFFFFLQRIAPQSIYPSVVGSARLVALIGVVRYYMTVWWFYFIFLVNNWCKQLQLWIKDVTSTKSGVHDLIWATRSQTNPHKSESERDKSTHTMPWGFCSEPEKHSRNIRSQETEAIYTFFNRNTWLKTRDDSQFQPGAHTHTHTQNLWHVFFCMSFSKIFKALVTSTWQVFKECWGVSRQIFDSRTESTQSENSIRTTKLSFSSLDLKKKQQKTGHFKLTMQNMHKQNMSQVHQSGKNMDHGIPKV